MDDICVKSNKVKYFDSFVVKDTAKEIKGFIGIQNIVSDFFGIQEYNSNRCGHIYIGFINFIDLLICNDFIGFMFDRESLIDFTKQFKVDRVIEKQDYLNEEIREREKISLVFISDTNGSVTAE